MQKFKVGTGKEDTPISARELQSAMLRRQVSAATLARGLGCAESTVYSYLKRGMPVKYKRNALKTILDDCELRVWGGRHMDAFPETLKNSL